MISKKFMIDYIEFFSPDAEKDEKTLEILSNFTDPYIEAANMAVLAIDKDRKIIWQQVFSKFLKHRSWTRM